MGKEGSDDPASFWDISHSPIFRGKNLLLNFLPLVGCRPPSRNRSSRFGFGSLFGSIGGGQGWFWLEGGGVVFGEREMGWVGFYGWFSCIHICIYI